MAVGGVVERRGGGAQLIITSFPQPHKVSLMLNVFSALRAVSYYYPFLRHTRMLNSNFSPGFGRLIVIFLHHARVLNSKKFLRGSRELTLLHLPPPHRGT